MLCWSSAIHTDMFDVSVQLKYTFTIILQKKKSTQEVNYELNQLLIHPFTLLHLRSHH